ncbi:penicillin-binding protein [Bailinhaonella thermotolerans]|uniref:Penicillin-binding protein n=2 Tax=Bailinhaonella thermotolerans TaxID=1070861 RepID=A0A3A4B435_9ACTN|nr:penicillin-binding protein [Bailinhaonella thermotolerans]
MYSMTPLPSDSQAQASATARGSVIYYNDGKKVLARLGTKRTPINLTKDVPKHVQDAVLAAENRGFREEPGISVRGMTRALWSAVTGGEVTGASTITQQVARNYYEGLSQERALSRKIKEIFIAIKMDQEKSKDDILELYLNTIYFGRGAYGIEAASQAFFKKSVRKLTVEEAAYIAGRIQNPVAFDNAEAKGNYAPTEGRFHYVIKGLATMDPATYGKYVSTSSGQTESVAKFAKPKKNEVRNYFKGTTGYMVDLVLRELKEKQNLSRDEIDRGGYSITSTFDPDMMNAAKRAVEGKVKQFGKGVQASLAAVDPKNGRVLAFYGGPDYLKKPWNVSFDARKQAASAFKPYVLAAWLDNGWSLNSYLDGNNPVKLEGTNPIWNAGRKSWGSIDVTKATANSVNSVFAKMGEAVGLDKVVKIASEAGLDESRLKDAEGRHRYLITIGSAEVSAAEQATGYAAFANEGKHYDRHVVIEVKQLATKARIYREKRAFKQVFSPEVAADATYAMQQVVKAGTGTNAALADRPVAGKTGTNNESKEAWFVGYTPQLSTAVGMYKEIKDKKGQVKEVPLPGDIGGGAVPAMIWRDFMAEALKGKPVEQFPDPARVGDQHDLAPKPKPTPTVEPTDSPEDTLPTQPPQNDDGQCENWPFCDNEGGPDDDEGGNGNPDGPGDPGDPGNPGDPGPGNPGGPNDPGPGSEKQNNPWFYPDSRSRDGS